MHDQNQAALAPASARQALGLGLGQTNHAEQGHTPIGIQADAVHGSISRLEELAVAIEAKLTGSRPREVLAGAASGNGPSMPTLRDRVNMAGVRLSDLEMLLTRIHDAL